MTKYRELLQHPKWQKKRLLNLRHAKWRCEECQDEETSLHVHHIYYLRGKKPWEYPDDALICLCKNCHKDVHADKLLAEALKCSSKSYDCRRCHEYSLDSDNPSRCEGHG